MHQQAAHRRHDWRTRLILALPSAVVESPFESMIAAFALITGPPQVAGIVRANSLALLFPPAFSIAYGAVLTVAGLTIAYGLRQGRETPPAAAGLRLAATAVAVYGVAVFLALGAGGFVAGAMFLAIAGLCALRSVVITTSRRWRARLAVEATQ